MARRAVSFSTDCSSPHVSRTHHGLHADIGAGTSVRGSLGSPGGGGRSDRPATRAKPHRRGAPRAGAAEQHKSCRICDGSQAECPERSPLRCDNLETPAHDVRSSGNNTCGFKIPRGVECGFDRAERSDLRPRLRTSGSHRRLAAPMPCSALIEPCSSATSPNTASSTRSSSGATPVTLTCTLPSPACPNSQTDAPGATLATRVRDRRRTNAASRSAGSVTSSLWGVPTRLIASVCASRYRHRRRAVARRSRPRRRRRPERVDRVGRARSVGSARRPPRRARTRRGARERRRQPEASHTRSQARLSKNSSSACTQSSARRSSPPRRARRRRHRTRSSATTTCAPADGRAAAAPR